MTDKQYLIKDSQIDALINAIADKLGHSNAKKWKSDLLQSLPMVTDTPCGYGQFDPDGKLCDAHDFQDSHVYTTPLFTSPQSPAVQGEPCNEDLATDIEAIDAMHRGSPTYEHDAYYMRDAAAKLVRKGYSIFTSPQALKQISADDVTDEMLEAVKKAIPMQGVVTREKVVAIYNAVIKNWSEA